MLHEDIRMHLACNQGELALFSVQSLFDFLAISRNISKKQERNQEQVLQKE